ncbi:hypothetical protein AMJ80_01605 [bacterium SM23_31]|nr:MAG: hypothetical protein AMJ80_01605 [bacterium SM23_31]
MFTGIIKTMGNVTSVQNRRERLYLKIEAKDFVHDLREGSSVAVDGACLTVTQIADNTFAVDAIRETLSKTTIPGYTVGRLVNLEKPLRFSDRMDGHIIQGHVDGTAVFVKKSQSGGNVWLSFRLPKDLVTGVVKKGSIAIDGISLTVADVRGDIVTAALIPFTLEHTTLSMRKASDLVNIETDIIGKYVARYLNIRKDNKSIAPFM